MFRGQVRPRLHACFFQTSRHFAMIIDIVIKHGWKSNYYVQHIRRTVLKILSFRFHLTSKTKEVAFQISCIVIRNLKKQNEILISEEKSIIEMKFKHKRRHKKLILEQSLHKMADRRRNKKETCKSREKNIWIK